MSNKFNERTGPFGNKYWEDENGKKIYERTGPFGNKYWEDENGNQINERTGPFGNKYYEDSDGKQTHERTGPFGNKYYEDSDGNQTNERTGPFGGNYLEQDAGAGFVPGSEKVEQTSRSRSSAGSGITESLSGLGWGTTVVLGLIALALFVVIGIPVLGGLLLIKLVNGILIPKTKNKRLWRWISFPVLFILGFMLTSELVAMGMWGFSCMSPNSSSCIAYIHQPYPTILGWHENIVRSRANNNSGNSVPQSSNTNRSGDVEQPYSGRQVVREVTWVIGSEPLQVDLEPREFLQVKEDQTIQGWWGPFDPKTGSYTNSQGEWVVGPRSLKQGYDAPCPNKPWIAFCDEKNTLNVIPNEINYWGEGQTITLQVMGFE